jgi:hypothetical protein
MSQYLAGTATVTNGSATVTGTNALWLAHVTAGDSFTVAGDGVMYDVASVDSDTQITLSAPYAGTTASGVVYAIGTGFTVPDSFPEMSQGDIETATIFTRAMRKIQSKFSALVSDISGKAAIAGGADANFTAMPQVGGDPIVESGSNADGNFTKWADGTMICFMSENISGTDVNTATGGLFVSAQLSWTHPVVFVGDDPTISLGAGGGFSNGTSFLGGVGPSLTTTNYYIVSAISGTDLNPPICITTIGRWK